MANVRIPERRGVITFKGAPLTLCGPEIVIGAEAPDFRLLAQDLSQVTLASSAGKTLSLIHI